MSAYASRIVAPASAVSTITGVVSLVVWSLVEPLLSVIETSCGCAGATVSTVTVCTTDTALALPAKSVALAVKLCVPSLSMVVTYLNVPAVAVSTAVPSRVTPS